MSPAAHEGLYNLAVHCGFNSPYYTSRGISTFLHACATAQTVWTDRRPPHVKEASHGAHQTPIWNDGSHHYHRSLGELPVSYLTTVAHSHHITPYARQRVTIEGLRTDRLRMVDLRSYGPVSVVSPVLEAIGLMWLQPVEPPSKLMLDKAPRPR